MNKIAHIIHLFAIAVLFSSAARADHHDWGRGNYGWGGGHGWGHHQYYGWGGNYGGYPTQPMNNYYPQPQGNYYYQQSPGYYQQQPQYYSPPPRYQHSGGYYQNRFNQGQAGGLIGNGFGYPQGNRIPFPQGIGTSAGPFIGNGKDWRK